MADCKKALTETDGDFEAAIEYLRKKGAASAAKRSDREANEGLVVAKISDDSKTAILTEITCETDFVAKNADFVDYADTVANTYLNSSAADATALKAEKVGDITVEDLHNGILSKFSEKIDINRVSKITTDGYVQSYIHGGSKLGVLVEVSSSNISDDDKAVVKDIAMQIAAMRPIAVDRSGVSAETLAKEIEIYKEQAVQEGKPAEIAERIANGRVEKFFKENTLTEQVFVKDSKKTIKDLMAEISKNAGEEVSIKQFVRLSIGE
jgi:elongation factor Ts